MIPFYSQENQVYPTVWRGRAAVEKRFVSRESWQAECSMYEKLRGSIAVPAVLVKRPKLLVTEYVHGRTLAEELDRQELLGFEERPWMALAAWLTRCRELTGLLPVEDPLGNFLWDRSRSRLQGVDLGSYEPVSLSRCGAVCVAQILESSPVEMPEVARAARLLGELLEVSGQEVDELRAQLRKEKGRQTELKMTGIILAGGRSSRMGRDKAKLELEGVPLLMRQVDKMQKMGIREILLSGPDRLELPGTRVVSDRYPQRGPLGGLHACLDASYHASCLVLSVDVPLVPPAALARLCANHRGGVTVLTCKGKEEPLIGVYDRSVAASIEPLIREGGAPVRRLWDHVECRQWEYSGPEEFLYNCNTPEDYERVKQTAERFRMAGIPLD